MFLKSIIAIVGMAAVGWLVWSLLERQERAARKNDDDREED